MQMDVLARLQRANDAVKANRKSTAKRGSGEEGAVHVPPHAGHPASQHSHCDLQLKQTSSYAPSHQQHQQQQQELPASKRAVHFGGDEDGELGKAGRAALAPRALNAQASYVGLDLSVTIDCV